MSIGLLKIDTLSTKFSKFDQIAYNGGVIKDIAIADAVSRAFVLY